LKRRYAERLEGCKDKQHQYQHNRED